MKLIGIIGGIFILVVGSLGWRASDEAATVHHVRGSLPNYEVADLAQHADAVALITPVGAPTVHWNSADGKPWADDAVGTRAHIYRDQRVEVLQVFSGAVPSDSIVVRGLGGRVGDIEVRYEDAPDFVSDKEYVAILEQVDAPTQDGFERVWAVVWQRHGLFLQAATGEWRSAVGKTLPAELLN